MIEVAVTVVGGGVVGCAVADALARDGREVILLEREPALARGITARNSEVVHGGMYYPPGSLKARCCVEGRRLLAEFCDRAGVPYRRCGKLIVATRADEEAALEELLARGRENGVEDLELVDAGDVARLEPQVAATAALHSPHTAVCDAEGVTRALARRAVAAGARILTGAEVTGLSRQPAGWRVTVAGDGRREGWTHDSPWVVNAAGLWADRLAALGGVDVEARGWCQEPVKGNYFAIDPRHEGRVERLVYPVPPADPGTLGVHLCLDLGGRLRLGPDVEHLEPRPAPEDLSYAVDPGRVAAFHAGAHRYLPWLEPGDLSPDTSGVRPRLEGGGWRDFVVNAGEGGTAGMVNLVGIDSPGLTSALAIAARVAGFIAAA